MTKESVAAEMLAAEVELRRAQVEHDGSFSATVRYQAARDRLVQLERLVVVLLCGHLSDPAGSLA